MKVEELALRDFVADDKLARLERDIQKFNPIKILKVQHHEIRHSNILAWLLTPTAKHNFKDYLVKKIVCETLQRNGEKDVVFPSVADINRTNLCDVEVRREWENIDIVIVSKENELIILIENKLRASERDGQLERYLETVKNLFPGFRILPIFLTVSEDEPGYAEYLILGHETIYDVVKSALELYRESIDSNVYDFIQYYLDVLEEIAMTNDSLIELCKEIYRQHGEAIDLIVRYAGQTCFTEACKMFVANPENKVKHIRSNSKRIVFIPKEFEGIVPEIDSDKNKYLVEYRFVVDDDSLELIIKVGQFPEVSRRKDFIKLLRQSGVFRITDKAVEKDSKTIRIYSQTIGDIDLDDAKEIVNGMEELYVRKFEKLNKELINCIRTFDWE